ncbi:MAG: ABC transporter ATP-binding protein [Kiritimatiellae bacterium]|nr:ABC transporter ATP-binding protein [Kiritimatiellia bacterium]
MDALKATGLCRSYGKGDLRTKVLDGFNFSLPPGAFEVLMGPSGSGKSTFLHIAAGLLAADAGAVEVGGADVTALGDGAAARFRRRHVGVVFQAFNLVDTLDVAANIELPVRLDRRIPDAARLDELLGKLGLAGKERRMPQELSGGERQRVAIARALYARPDVILADEPTGNLDVASAKSVRDMLRSIHEGEKSAILLVTHDPVVAAAANRVHFLKDGRIAASHDIPSHDPAEISRLYLEVYK